MSIFVLTTSEHGSMIVNGLDTGVGSQILRQGIHEPEVVLFGIDLATKCFELHGKGVVILDVGANIGSCTIPWARHMRWWGRVVAYEPQEISYYALAGNIALNNVMNARAKHVAVGDHPHIMKIPQMNYNVYGNFGGLHLREKNVQHDKGDQQAISYKDKDMIDVPVIPLNDEDYKRVDILKIDVEGMELDVLEGADCLITECRPTIIIEYIHCGAEVITNFLGEAYTYFQLGGNLICVPWEHDLLEFVKTNNKGYAQYA